MEVEGVVSLWVGRCDAGEVLEAALHVTFSEDGDFLGSPFSREFGIEYYEDATREYGYEAVPPETLPALLAEVSYADVILPRLRDIGVRVRPSDNCAVLLYNIQYEGTQRRWRAAGLDLGYCGTVTYE